MIVRSNNLASDEVGNKDFVFTFYFDKLTKNIKTN